ncbi:PqqD family protein [Natronolimnobius sp. AArcel1]|uniref:PqqD family protein n=1 Tax=Natronolimnobius sp. AArcel1 TaxID=1679093 RepID=UPI0013EC2E13|nr:PqqD family protein [Natronolimnobius sp. AArcel1]NGM70334.1 PqqD family protein [Natronolimnobius sp. AArcel1]
MGDSEPIAPSTVVVATESHLATTIEDETVLLELESGTYYGFNEVGSQLWELLQEPQTVGDLCETIQSTYDEVPTKQCRRDVQTVLEEMDAAGLVEIEANTATSE